MTKRVKNMFFIQALSLVITFADKYLLIPLLAVYYDIQQLSIWLILQIIPSYINMCDLGMPLAAGNYMIKSKKNGHDQKAYIMHHLTKGFLTKVTALILLIGIYISINAQSMFNINNTNDVNIFLLSYGLILYALMTLYTQIILIKYRYHHEYVTHNFYIQISRIIEIIIAFYAITHNAPMHYIPFCFFTVRLFVNLFLDKKISDPQAPEKELSIKEQLTTLKKIYKSSLGFALIPFAQNINLHAFSWCIAYFMNPAIAATFIIYRTYSRVLYQVGEFVKRAIFNEMAIKYDKKLMYLSLAITVFFNAFIGICLYLLADKLIFTWTNGTIKPDPFIICQLIICAFLGSVKNVTLSAKMAKDMHTKFVTFEIISNAIGLSFCLLMSHNLSMSMITYILILIELSILIYMYISKPKNKFYKYSYYKY